MQIFEQLYLDIAVSLLPTPAFPQHFFWCDPNIGVFFLAFAGLVSHQVCSEQQLRRANQRQEHHKCVSSSRLKPELKSLNCAWVSLT